MAITNEELIAQQRELMADTLKTLEKQVLDRDKALNVREQKIRDQETAAALGRRNADRRLLVAAKIAAAVIGSGKSYSVSDCLRHADDLIAASDGVDGSEIL